MQSSAANSKCPKLSNWFIGISMIDSLFVHQYHFLCMTTEKSISIIIVCNSILLTIAKLCFNLFELSCWCLPFRMSKKCTILSTGDEYIYCIQYAQYCVQVLLYCYTLLHAYPHANYPCFIKMLTQAISPYWVVSNVT